MHKHTHARTVAFRNGCHRHSSVDTTSTPKLQLFSFALSACASEWESTCFLTKNICNLRLYKCSKNQVHIEANAAQLLTSFLM